MVLFYHIHKIGIKSGIVNRVIEWSNPSSLPPPNAVEENTTSATDEERDEEYENPSPKCGQWNENELLVVNLPTSNSFSPLLGITPDRFYYRNAKFWTVFGYGKWVSPWVFWRDAVEPNYEPCWASNFRVRMLLKGAVSRSLYQNQSTFLEFTNDTNMFSR